MGIAIRPLALVFAKLLAGGVLSTFASAEPTRSALSDAHAEARIETTHRLNPCLRSDRIDIKVTDGVATWMGSVRA
jgi:hypothetical protein